MPGSHRPNPAPPPAWPGRLLRRSTWRYARRHPWQTWLSFLGIMLGVMMVVAVDLANSSARRAFTLSMESVTGRITHQIVGGSSGVPDALYTRLRTELGLRRSAPGLSGQVRLGGRDFTLLGIDPISEATLQRARPGLRLDANALGGDLFAAFANALSGDVALLMSEAGAAVLGLAPGDAVAVQAGGQRHQGRLAAVFASANPAATEGLVFADIAVAQGLLDRRGRIDSIDLVLEQDEAERLRQWLPAAYSLARAEARSDSLEQMSSAFHVNLLAMSLLSLLVAALLIYNTMTLSVLQRRQTLGIFRAQGVQGREIFSLILLEAGVLGALASLAGLAAGLGLGQILVQLVTRTIDDLYFNLSVSRFLLDPWSLARGFGLGLGVSLLAAALPAWHAARSVPVSLRQVAVQDQRWQARLPWMSALGVALMLAGGLLLQPDGGSLAAGFVALTLVIFGFCLLVPALVWGAIAALLALGRRRLGATAKMALRGIQQGISRTGLAVAALTVAVSVTVGVGVMVGSFRDTVGLWLDQSLSGDIQVSQGARSRRIPAAVVEEIAALPRVEDVLQTLESRVETALGPVRLQAGDGAARGRFFLREASAAGLQRYAQGEGILVSEPLAYLHGLAVGESLRVLTPAGARDLPIVGVFHDYSSNLGLVALHASLYQRWWEDYGATRLTVEAAPGADLARLREEIRALLPAREGSWFVTANAEIRRITLAIFDRTFAITKVLRLLALVVAFVGVLSALMALQLERLREFAILRATGMTPGQVAGLIFIRTVLMGLFAGLLAIPLGLLMADILIDVINRRSFGWSMQQLLPPGVLWEGLLLALGAAALAGLYPAWRAAGISPAAALREE